MFTKEITYTDFNGTERKEKFYFHLSTPELLRLEGEIGTDIKTHTEKLAKSNNFSSLLEFIEKIILTSYGRKTEDGRSFQKSEELRKEFEYSQAYANLFEEMINNTDLARKFGEGIVGGKAKQNFAQQVAK